MSKRIMAKARVDKKDEFYTKRETIENELKYYTKHFENKVVYCNCDDPQQSNFVKFFIDNFDKFKLKKLIASCYKEQNYNLFNMKESFEKATWLEYEGQDIEIKEFNGDGDFRSEESIRLLKETDIVVTNPPFSLFKEHVAQLYEYEKDFLIIGTTNAASYKDFFKLLMKNEVWAGVSFNKTVEFMIPEEYTEWERIEDGAKYGKVPSISWWTNLTHDKKEELNLVKTYKGNEENYPRYLNYDGIDVSKLSEIPIDYTGTMGVPITFIGTYDPLKFEIIGLGAGEIYKEIGGKVIGEQFLSDYFSSGGKGNYVSNQNILCYYDDNGKPIIPYMRILIQNKC